MYFQYMAWYMARASLLSLKVVEHRPAHQPLLLPLVILVIEVLGLLLRPPSPPEASSFIIIATT